MFTASWEFYRIMGGYCRVLSAPLEHRQLLADSSGGCNTCVVVPPWMVVFAMVMIVSCGVDEFEYFLAWFLVVECFAGPVVEFLSDRVEVRFRVDAQISAFREILA